MVKTELRQYNHDYDRYEKDPRFITTQIETTLRERFNVLLSKIEYGISDGHLVREGKKEPFTDSIKRGRRVVQILDPRPVDFEREDAEVIGFEGTIDPFLSNPETPLGSKVLSVSLKGEEGSKYGHNFYDIFTLKRRDGKRYVELSRYSSALDAQEYAKRLPGFDPDNPPSAAEFLANPIPITNIFISAEQIHQMLHEEHDYTPPSVFDEVWKTVSDQQLIEGYISNRTGRRFNAILNFTDEVMENRKKREEGVEYRDYKIQPPSYMEKISLEEREVRQVPTACPGKSGADLNTSPYSVSELADMDYDFDQPGPCKNCGADINCGPCGICRSCDMKIRREESLKIAA